MATEGLIRALQPRQGATGGGLGGTLQTIRQGGTLPQNTLAGQISNIRAQRQAAQQAMQQNLRDYLLDRWKAQTDARRKAVQSQTELDEMRRARAEQEIKRRFGVARKLLTEAEANPNLVRENLVRNPERAQRLGVDPSSPNWKEQLQGAHDRFRAQVTGDVPSQPGDERTARQKEAEAAGLEPGTEAYRDFILRSRGAMPEEPDVPTTVRELEAAGYEQGTEEFRDAYLRIKGAATEDEVTVKSTDTYLHKPTDTEETLVRTDEFGLARQTVDDQGNRAYVPVDSQEYTKIDRRKVETETIGGQKRKGGPLEMGDVIPHADGGDFPLPDPQLAAGPRDRLIAVTTRIPVVKDVMQAIVGDPEAGIPERTAARLGDEIENLTVSAYRMSKDDFLSNSQIELARKLAPKMNFLTTDESVMTDLRTLHERTIQKIENEIAVANNEKFNEKIRHAAEERALLMGRLAALTGPLVQAAEDPKFPVESLIGAPISEADPDKVKEVMSEMTASQRKRVFDSLDTPTREALFNAWSKGN